MRMVEKMACILAAIMTLNSCSGEKMSYHGPADSVCKHRVWGHCAKYWHYESWGMIDKAIQESGE